MTRRSKASAATRTPSLTRDAVATAALHLIDHKGLEAVTMRALANRLGVRAQSLYTHVDSRQDLFDAVAEHIVNDIEGDLDARRVDGESWPHHLVGTARAVRRYAQHHPSAFVLLATRPAHRHSPQPPLRWNENILANLNRNGFSDAEANFACRAFDAFLLGSLLLEIRDLPGEAVTSETVTRTSPTDKDRHENRTIQRTARRPAHDSDDDFTSALDNVIDRITLRVGRRI